MFTIGSLPAHFLSPTSLLLDVAHRFKVQTRLIILITLLTLIALVYILSTPCLLLGKAHGFEIWLLVQPLPPYYPLIPVLLLLTHTAPTTGHTLHAYAVRRAVFHAEKERGGRGTDIGGIVGLSWVLGLLEFSSDIGRIRVVK